MLLLLAGAIDKALHAALLHGGDDRPDIVVVIVGLVEFQLFDGARQVRDQIVVDLLARVDAARGGAILPGIVEAERLYARDDRGDIRIVKHDDGRLAAKLQMRALQRGRRRLQHLLPRSDAARQRHHRDLGMIDQRVACRRAAPVMTLTTPSGKISAMVLASLRVVNGVISDGLMTIVLPPASAGASFQAAIISG